MADMNSLMNADLYKPNSNKSKREGGAEKESESSKMPPKNVEKVVKGDVTSKETPALKKAAMALIPDDTTENIKTYIVADVLIPTIKDTIMNVISMIIYGGEIRPSGKGGYYNYNGVSNKKNRTMPANNQRTSKRMVHDFREVTFQTRGDAMEVLSRMNELIEDYGTCTVEDFYIYIGEGGNAKHTDRNWGWTSLQGVNVSRVLGGGYCIDLPKVEHLD